MRVEWLKNRPLNMYRFNFQPFIPHHSAAHPSSQRMITLLTDFGTADYFIPAVKGVILSINPKVRIIDLTHEIPAQDIAAGAFHARRLLSHTFPTGTIHVAVVDPGVGSARRGDHRQSRETAVSSDRTMGLFSYVYKPWNHKLQCLSDRARANTFAARSAPTFHGRDVFAPVAAWLSRGAAAGSLLGAKLTITCQDRPQILERGPDFSHVFSAGTD